MWLLRRYTYDNYIKKLRMGNFRDPWLVHQGSLYMFFLGYEQEAISTVRVALSLDVSPVVVRTLAFLESMYYGIERAYEIYRKYFKKLLSEDYPPEYYQWETLFVGDLAFFLGDEDKGWFYYKRYFKPYSEYMLRRKARLFFQSAPDDSKLLYSRLVEEKKPLSVGDILRYAYLLGPRDGRKFLYSLINNDEIGSIMADIADKDFGEINQYIDNIPLYPTFEGIVGRSRWKAKDIVLSIEVLSHLLGTLYMPWNNLFLSRKGILKEKIRIPYKLWDWAYSYEYHYAYLPPWWREGVIYLEDRWKVNMLILSKKVGGKRRCIWGNRVICNEIIDIYDSSLKPILEVI